jgi:exosortase A
MTVAISTAPALSARAGLRAAAVALLLGLACLGLLFHAEAAAAVAVWLDSTAYSHCFFVLPIAAWLAWDRRAAVRGRRPAPTAWPALAALPCGLAWFAAERLGLMEGRQLAALGMVEALALAVLGFRLARAFAAPLAYLIFLVPFGAFLVPTLQAVTTWFVEAGLELFGIPHYVDAFVIEIPEGTFFVAEACAGLRFLIAAVAFGALYACLIYRSPWRRLAFLAVAVVIPILANGIRALGIVVAGHLIGDTEAAAADHLIYGWGFFSLVIVLLTLAGLPFRQDMRAAPPPPGADDAAAPGTGDAAAPGTGDAARPAGWALGAAGAVVVLAAAAPVAAALLNRAGAAPDLALPGFAASADCRPTGDPPGPVQHFDCQGGWLTATLRVLPPHAAPAALRAARAEATGERDAADAATSQLVLDGVQPRVWRLVQLSEPSRLSATAEWVDGAPDPGGLSGRLRLAWNSVAGSASPPVLVAASLLPASLQHEEDRAAARRILHDFLAAQGRLLAAIPRATAAARQ